MSLEEITIRDILIRNAKRWPDSVAMEYEGRLFTWEELGEITKRLAFSFHKQGIKRGTHVGILGRNSPNWICAYLALARLGAVSVLLNYKYKEQEVLRLLDYGDAEVLCYGENVWQPDEGRDQGEEAACWDKGPSCRFLWIGRDENTQWYGISNLPQIPPEEEQIFRREEEAVKTGDILSMVFTSGTTAKPKGVLLSHCQMLNVALETARQMRWTRKDKCCLALSLFHCFGLSAGLLAGLVSGNCICLLPDFHSIKVLKAIEEKRCTILNGVPSMFLAMLSRPEFLQYDLSTLRSGIIAGSGIRKKDYDRIVKAFGMPHLQQSFGQTECSPSVTFSGYYDPLSLKSVSAGRAIGGVELRIGGPDGMAVKPGEDGEILVRGYNVMKYGYYKRERLTREAMIKGGWLKTGDLGYLDGEGNLYVTGRIKDIIIRCGENISPKELEEVMLEYPKIRDVLVMGVEAPVVQEEIAACIVAEEGYDEKELLQYLRSRLADYKVPKYIVRFDSFPLFPNGKVNKKEMKNRVITRMKEER